MKGAYYQQNKTERRGCQISKTDDIENVMMLTVQMAFFLGSDVLPRGLLCI